MTPCILPWINFSTNTFGRARVCGYSENKSSTKLKDTNIADEWNSENFRIIRKDFLDGKWPENCRRCGYVENLNGSSKRIEENDRWYDEYKHLIEQTASDGSVPYHPPHIDVRTGMICNLKCIHCGTGASSKWREDKNLLNKYPNTEDYFVDNRWIENETAFWDHLRSIIHQTKRYNFLGGESFANKQHNLFLKDLAESKYAKNVAVSYTTNGSLIDIGKLEQLNKLKFVSLRISVDALGDAGEYFRYPINLIKFYENLKLINDYVENKNNFYTAFQWTCSNISIFYLTETYEELSVRFPNIKFIFCNHVEFPIHMSAQNLPKEIKETIVQKIQSYKFKDEDENIYPFYMSHMLEKDLWNEHGKTLIQYLDDLDIARNTDWKKSFRAMGLENYIPR